MKATTTIVIAAVLVLQTTVLFYCNDITLAPFNEDNATITHTSIVPAVPNAARVEGTVITNDLEYIVPSTPSDARFEDLSYESVAALNLAPAPPAAADFEDGIDFSSLAPVVPAEADFE
jgi:hypothetical protein